MAIKLNYYYLCLFVQIRLRIRRKMMKKYDIVRLLIIAIIMICGLVPATILAQQKFTVVLDAGHGGQDPGAIGRKIKAKEIKQICLFLYILMLPSLKQQKVLKHMLWVWQKQRRTYKLQNEKTL